jgi:hypothetical protein
MAMTDVITTARRMLEQTGEHPVLSLYFDLDPSEFATAPARATQLRSLVDQAHAEIERTDAAVSHQDRVALKADLERVESYLRSGRAPVSGARALAVFCSAGDDLFETVPLHRPAAAQVAVGRTPLIAPMLTAGTEEPWCVALVNRSSARILAGSPPTVRERGEIDDDVHGRHRQGGWSWPRYERGIEEEVDDHLRRVARELQLRLEREPYHTLVLGGPSETVSRLRGFLSGDVQRILAEQHLSLGVQSASDDDVRQAIEPILRLRRSSAERDALERVRIARGRGEGRAASGWAPTEQALAEQRVERLLLAPPDGSPPDRRERAIEAAIRQDADVLVFSVAPPETDLRDGVGALLRF